MSILLALTASLAWGTSAFTGGMAAKKMTSLVVTFITILVNVVIVGAIALVLQQKVIGIDLLWGAAAGTTAIVGMITLLLALSRGRMGVVAPLAASIAGLLPFVYGVIKGDGVSITDALGVCLVMLAIVFLTRTPKPDEDLAGAEVNRAVEREAVRNAAIAGTAFGLTIAFISNTSGDSGVWPLVAERCTMILLLGVYLLFNLKKFIVEKDALRPTVVSGASQALGDTAYMYALYGGPLTIVGVLGGLYPAATVLLARFILKEHLQRGALVGLIFALGGIVLFSVG